jgi:hypothetical protein
VCLVVSHTGTAQLCCDGEALADAAVNMHVLQVSLLLLLLLLLLLVLQACQAG